MYLGNYKNMKLCFSRPCLVFRKMWFADPSESSGMQNDVQNRLSGAEDFEILAILSSSKPLVESSTGAQELAKKKTGSILDDLELIWIPFKRPTRGRDLHV